MLKLFIFGLFLIIRIKVSYIIKVYLKYLI